MAESKGDTKGEGKSPIPVGLFGEVASNALFVTEGDTTGVGRMAEKYFDPEYASKFMTEFQVGKQKLKFYGNPMAMRIRSNLFDSFMSLMKDSDPPYDLATQVDIIYPRSLMAVWIYMNGIYDRFYTNGLTSGEIVNLWSWVNYFDIPLMAEAVRESFFHMLSHVPISDIKDAELPIIGNAARKMVMMDKGKGLVTNNVRAFRDNTGIRRRLLGLDFFDVSTDTWFDPLTSKYRRVGYMEKMDIPADIPTTPSPHYISGRAIYYNKLTGEYYFIDLEGIEAPLLPENEWQLVNTSYVPRTMQGTIFSQAPRFIAQQPLLSVGRLGVPAV